MINPMDLTGKRYIVTGASSGIGRQTCITISQLGGKVSLVARNEKKLHDTVNMMDGVHDINPYDLTNFDDIENLIKGMVDRNGKYDGLVHCAGIGTVAPVSMSKYSFMKKIMDINFFSFIEMTRLLSKKGNSNDKSSFVAISSVSSKYTDKSKVGYTSSKGALDSAVRELAIELGTTRQMRFNTVNPCWVKTEMYDNYLELFGRDKLERELSNHILGVARPQDIANVVAFLLSDAACKITGQNIFVESGCTLGYK